MLIAMINIILSALVIENVNFAMVASVMILWFQSDQLLNQNFNLAYENIKSLKSD